MISNKRISVRRTGRALGKDGEGTRSAALLISLEDRHRGKFTETAESKKYEGETIGRAFGRLWIGGEGTIFHEGGGRGGKRWRRIA